jgi:hypothetical protein
MKSTIFMVLITFILASCSPGSVEEDVSQIFLDATQRSVPIQPEMLTPYTSPQPTDTTTPTLTPTPSITLEPRESLVPTLTPSSINTQPVVLLEINGTGNTTSDNYQLPRCWKAVFYWSVSPNTNGTASLTLNLHQIPATNLVTLVNIDTTDLYAKEFTGSVLQGLIAGEYSFSIENTEEAWTIRVECQDNVAPIKIGLNIQATGWFVSDNYILPTCQNGIFSWSVEPNANDIASLVLYFCDMKRCVTMVDEENKNTTDKLSGQVTAMLQSGTYFIGAKNTLQSWSVIWECKDQ